ncbi:MAG: hypothetical protein JW889_13635 [Verrucomicrobia bacterium]|nr:hypothetical protein [Verrucomicrobiota bacterium]
MRSFRLMMLVSALALIGGVIAWQFVARTGQAQEGAELGGGGSVSEASDPKEPSLEELEKSAQVWIEATFVQIDTADLDKVKTTLGNSFDSQTGKPIIEGKEKEELLLALKDRPSFEILGSAALVAIASDGRHYTRIELGEEVRYPSEYEAKSGRTPADDGKTVASSEPVVVPSTFETRLAGVSLSVSPRVSSDGKSVIVEMNAQVTFLAGYMTYGTSKTFSQPILTSWDLVTTLRIGDGMTLVLTHVPTKNFEQSYVLNPQQTEGLKGKKSALLLISAKIIDPGKRQ